MTLRLLPFEEFKRLPVNYKGIAVGDFEADFVVDEKIILELKAVTVFHPKHEAQAINYLAATSLKLAVLLNFGADSLQYKRAINRNIHGE